MKAFPGTFEQELCLHYRLEEEGRPERVEQRHVRCLDCGLGFVREWKAIDDCITLTLEPREAECSTAT